MQHISLIDWAFQAFMSNHEVNIPFNRCKIGKIKIGEKSIQPDMFIKLRRQPDKNTGVWN